MQLDHVAAGRRLQHAAQMRTPCFKPLFFEIRVLLADLMQAGLRAGNHQLAHPVGDWQHGQARSLVRRRS
jgi:hypothetical protein